MIINYGRSGYATSKTGDEEVTYKLVFYRKHIKKQMVPTFRKERKVVYTPVAALTELLVCSVNIMVYTTMSVLELLYML